MSSEKRPKGVKGVKGVRTCKLRSGETDVRDIIYTRARSARARRIYAYEIFVRARYGQKKRSNTKLQERIETTFVSALCSHAV